MPNFIDAKVFKTLKNHDSKYAFTQKSLKETFILPFITGMYSWDSFLTLLCSIGWIIGLETLGVILLFLRRLKLSVGREVRKRKIFPLIPFKISFWLIKMLKTHKSKARPVFIQVNLWRNPVQMHLLLSSIPLSCQRSVLTFKKSPMVNLLLQIHTSWT